MEEHAGKFVVDAKSKFQEADPFMQVFVLIFAVVVLSGGSLIWLVACMAMAFYVFTYGLPLGAESVGVKTRVVEEGDALSLTPEKLDAELKDLDPKGEFPFLYSQPEMFHLLFQVGFMRKFSTGAFYRILHAIDKYAELSYTVKNVQELRDPVNFMNEAIVAARAIMNDYHTIPLDVTFAFDKKLKGMFLDTGEALQIVIKRDLDLVYKASENASKRDPHLFGTLPVPDGPRAPNDLEDMMRFGGSKTMF
jgi:hypothetical protein